MHRDSDTRRVVHGVRVQRGRQGRCVLDRCTDRARIGIERHAQPGRVTGIKDYRAEVPQTRHVVKGTVARTSAHIAQPGRNRVVQNDIANRQSADISHDGRVGVVLTFRGIRVVHGLHDAEVRHPLLVHYERASSVVGGIGVERAMGSHHKEAVAQRVTGDGHTDLELHRHEERVRSARHYGVDSPYRAVPRAGRWRVRVGLAKRAVVRLADLHVLYDDGEGPVVMELHEERDRVALERHRVAYAHGQG